ncbi:outer membrane beta-barrel protein [Luteimonas sp. e5]
MRNFITTALFAACLISAPRVHAGETFVNAGIGHITQDNEALDKDSSTLLQLGGGHRWGIGPFKAGIEAGIGRIGETRGHRDEATSGPAFTASADHLSIGANARIKPPLLPVQFIARAGYIGVRHRLEQGGVDADSAWVRSSHRSGGDYLGAGIGTTVLPLLDVSLMVNRYRIGHIARDDTSGRYRISSDKRSAHSVDLVAEYRF